MNLSTFQIDNTIFINDIIHKAYFLDDTNTLIAVFCQHSFIIADITTNRTYSMPPIPFTSVSADHNSSIFTCVNNAIKHDRISFTSPSIEE